MLTFNEGICYTTLNVLLVLLLSLLLLLVVVMIPVVDLVEGTRHATSREGLAES